MMKRDGRAHLTRAAALLAGCTLLAVPASASTIRGRVLDRARRAALPGASVRVQGTAIGTVADRDGSFVIADAPDGPQTLVVRYVGYEDATEALDGTGAQAIEIALGAASADAGAGEIVVTGTRLAERRALQAKKISDNVVEALYANDVGKLPDQNVAEAVRRLPGLSVANDQGEGRYVVIRGINPNLVNVVLNGQTLPAPEPDGRQVKLDDIPSALISAVIVTKSLTADQDANAIGGEVNIQTLTAFDRNKGFFVDARGDYGRYALNHRHPYEADAQAGGLFGADRQFGAVVSVNYSRRPIQSENFQGSTNYRAVNGFVVPDQYGLREYNLVRERFGAVVNLDWRPSDAVKLFLRGTYSRFSDDETRDQNRIDNSATTSATSANFFNQTPTNGSFRGRGAVLVRVRDEKDNTRSLQGGGHFDIGGGALDAVGTYTRAVKRDPLRSEFNFRTGGTTITYDYDLSDPVYLVTPAAASAATAADPTRYTFNSVQFDTRLAVETLWQGRIDYKLPIAVGDGSSIKLGAKYLDRHKTNERDVLAYSAGTTPFTLGSTGVSAFGDPDFYDGRHSFGRRIDYDAALAFLRANPGTFAINANTTRTNSLVNDYDVRERILAGYATATLKFGALTLIPGVRVEHTRDRNKAKVILTAPTAGASSQPSDGFNSFGGTSYTDVFPGVNARYDITERVVARAAITTAIGRPNYPDLAPTTAVDLTASPVTVTLGNPDLKPYKAVSLDAALEYYLPGQGVLSVGLFYKHLDDPIYSQSLLSTPNSTVGSGMFGGQTLAGASIIQPLNADKAVVKGIEFNAQVQLTFLPSPLDGFGVSANFTLIGGHASGLAGRAGEIPLFLQSKRVGTAQLFYEKYGITARVAYTYRAKYLDLLGATAATDQYTDKNGQLDVRAGYAVTPHFTLFAEGTNLNDAPWRRFIGIRSQLIERERYDYALRGGVQLSF